MEQNEDIFENQEYGPAPGTQRLRLRIAYRGTRYSGWQIQARRSAVREPTIQERVEQAFSTLAGRPLRVIGASRTDAGVHALGQVAHVDTPAEKNRIDWQRAGNAHLPRDIALLEAAPAPPGFHARFSVQHKFYTYSLWLTRRYVLPQRRPFVWAVGPLDVEAMDRAAALLVGSRDFKCFQNVGTEVVSTVRNLMSVVRIPNPAGQDDPGEPEVTYRFQADGFLKQMIRNMVGFLVAVGQGKLPPEALFELIEGRDRRVAPATAAPQGLTLERIVY
jgi:tRNA pseudouridine38-40 synthase